MKENIFYSSRLKYTKMGGAGQDKNSGKLIPSDNKILDFSYVARYLIEMGLVL